VITQNKVYSIKELTSYIKTVFDQDNEISDVWIKGEISNFTHHSSGHMYFTLKDEASRLRAIMFAGNNRFLKFIPKNGTKVLARGYISVYERDGQYQFYAQEMQPDGIGNLYLAFEQLKERLDKEGLFDIANKKQPPFIPKTIGIVTSSTGAAIRDIITTIKRRFPMVNLLIYPVLVQGTEAKSSIVKALEHLNMIDGIDLIIVGRGGGSIEELWAFNEEVVARGIYASTIPVISAVGHETDFTIADFVADIRAATPTAAAELAVPHIEELKLTVNYLEKRLQRHLVTQHDVGAKRLSQLLSSMVFRRPKQILLENAQRLDRLEERLTHSLYKHITIQKERFQIINHKFLQLKPDYILRARKETLTYLEKQLLKETKFIMERKHKLLEANLNQLDALSPLKVMRRGYAIPYDNTQEKVIRSIKEVQLSDILKIKLNDGTIDCQVWGMEDNNNES